LGQSGLRDLYERTFLRTHTPSGRADDQKQESEESIPQRHGDDLFNSKFVAGSAYSAGSHGH
jgi:hypothetical protein